ncbi:hypothetical protein [Paenibacillus sp.]|jgi:hypothetical protein|uniref:hypothetical protein n=1 Tax=Paenibacillus sp. TaxID=58172 RepID=UPI0028322EFB|nr:hypothetical protein [Paenibacillus sp.]MDR0271670.1 hypothetical protein [Paenibacillus sp.]
MKKKALFRTGIYVIVFSLFFSISSVSVLAKTNQQNIAQSYYKILNNIISKYGISTFDNEEGLVYANMIDFDKNGVSELYILYLKKDNSRGYDQLKFYQEVWGFEKSELHKLYFDDQGPDGLISDRSISITSTNKNSYLIFESSYSTGNGTPPYDNEWSLHRSIMTVKGGKLIEVAVLGYTEASKVEGEGTKYTYTIKTNGKVKNISNKEYNNYVTQYNLKNQKYLIDGDAGSPTISFDASSNVKTINSFLKRLKNMM